MAQEADFLGLAKSFADAHATTSVWFWVHQRLQDKVQDLISEAFRDQVLRPGTASKLYGCLTFLNTGCYAKLGRSGLNAIKERQQGSSVRLTEAIIKALQQVLDLLQLRPTRLLHMNPKCDTRFIAASDAARHAHEVGSAGALFVGGDASRLALVMEVSSSL